MANSVATVTIQRSDVNGKLYRILGTLSIGAAPLTYVTGGIPCPFIDPLVKASRAPISVNFTSQNGFIYSFVPGTTNANGLLKMFSVMGTELGSGVTIPTANSSDVINFIAYFLGQN